MHGYSHAHKKSRGEPDRRSSSYRVHHAHGTDRRRHSHRLSSSSFRRPLRSGCGRWPTGSATRRRSSRCLAVFLQLSRGRSNKCLSPRPNRAQLLILEALSRSQPLTRADLEKQLRMRLVFRVFSDLCTDALAALVLANKIGVAPGGHYILKEPPLPHQPLQVLAEFREPDQVIRHRRPNKRT